MGFVNWLTGKGHPAKGMGGIKLINGSRSAANVRIKGAHDAAPQVPAWQDCLVRLPVGKYTIRFGFEDEIETYEVDNVPVVPETVTPFTLTTTAKSGQKLKMVSGPV
jgi:hypothetical protein